ncbi:MAG: hypothetical protein ACJ749_04530 [Flavisolibacter sp.]
MALQITIQYHDRPVTYDVTTEEEGVYILRYSLPQARNTKDYIPVKLVIRRKGKIWVSDADIYPELVNALTQEICNFAVNHNSAA